MHAQDPADGLSQENVNTLAALKSATHAAHVRINHHPFLSGLTKPAYPLGRYQALLVAYFHLYAAIERQIDAFEQHGGCPFDYRDRRKLPWLAADLQYFGIDPHTSALRPVRPLWLAPFTDVGALAGVLYVIEGATLGGQIISRHLHANLGLGPSAGARFFNGYGDTVETQKRWQAFTAIANTVGNEPNQRRFAEQMAVHLFDAIEKLLNDCHARFDH